MFVKSGFYLSVILVLVGMLRPEPALDSNPTILTDDQDKYSLALQAEILTDPTYQLTVEDVAGGELDDQFAPSRQEPINFGYMKTAKWVRFRLQNRTTDTTDWRLEIGDPTINLVQLYYAPDSNRGDFIHKQIGDTIPFTRRETPHHNLVFTLRLEPTQSYTVYLRVVNYGSTRLPLILWTPEAFAQQNYHTLFKFGFYYGFLFIMVCYNLFLFFFLWDLSYLYYVLFIANLGLYNMVNDGLANQYLWPEATWWGNISILVFIGLALLNGLNFGNHFLLLKQYSPPIHKTIELLKVVIIIVTILALWPGNYRFVAQTLSILTVMTVTIAVVSGFLTWHRGYAPARYFLIAWGVVLGSALVVVLAQFDLLPMNFLALYGIQIGVFLMVLLLALALADRINLLQAETSRANRRLGENESRLRQFLNALPLGVAVVDDKRETQYINRQARHIFGQRADQTASGPLSLESIFRQFPLYVRDADRPYPAKQLPLSRALLEGKSTSADDIELRRPGRNIPLEVWASPVFDETGHITYAITAFQDITHRKQTEAELAEYRLHLEDMVARRTEELDQLNQQLQHAMDQLEAHVDELSTLNLIIQTVATLTDLNSALQIVARTITHLFDALACNFILLDSAGTEATVVADYSSQESVQGLNLTLNNDSIATEVLQPSQTLVITPPEPTFRLFQQLVGRKQTEEAMIAPLLVRGKTIGIISVESAHTGRSFTPAEISLVETIAGQIAGAIENARLFQQEQAANIALSEANRRMQEELVLAQKIQRGLLPPPRPGWARLDVICYSKPAQEVGGDFYRYHMFNPNRFALAVGDVAGKGVSAALLMAASLSQFDASLSQPFTPVERLTYLDAAIMPYTRQGYQNCAICYVEIEIEEDRCQAHMINAACIPPYIRRQNGQVEHSELGGFALGQGLGVESGYQQLTRPLDPGDLIILVSDGVVEATNAHNQLLGFDRLQRIIQAAPAENAEMMMAHLKQKVEEFTGRTKQADDRTIIVGQIVSTSAA